MLQVYAQADDVIFVSSRVCGNGIFDMAWPSCFHSDSVDKGTVQDLGVTQGRGKKDIFSDHIAKKY